MRACLQVKTGWVSVCLVSYSVVCMVQPCSRYRSIHTSCTKYYLISTKNIFSFPIPAEKEETRNARRKKERKGRGDTKIKQTKVFLQPFGGALPPLLYKPGRIKNSDCFTISISYCCTTVSDNKTGDSGDSSAGENPKTEGGDRIIPPETGHWNSGSKVFAHVPEFRHSHTR